MTTTTLKVAAYNVLICLAVSCASVVVGMLFGPYAMLPCLALVACAAPLGRTVWP